MMSRKFKEFRVEDLFFIKSNLQLNKDSFRFVEYSNYPYFTRTVLNNGIAGYVEYLDEEHKIAGNCIAVGMLGMRFFYMESDFYAGQFTKAIIPKFPVFNKKIAQYFITWFNKNEKVYKGFLVRDFEKMFYNTTLSLPITSTGSIDYAFIEEYISKLEEEYIGELEEERRSALDAYLDVAGLNDFLLTAEEHNAIEFFNNGKVEFGEFKIGSKDGLFDIQKGKRLTKMDMRKGNTNYIGAISQNNGIRQKISAKPLHQGNCITVNYNGSVGEAFYQTEPFWASDDVNVLYLKGYELNSNLALYLITHIKKKGLLFSYQNKWNVERMEKTSISLPIKNKQPDFDFMETYIKATQKLVIKDIVDSKDEIIHKTKEVVRN